MPASTPATWQAPLPHQGSLGDLAQWWAQWGDPLLVDLIREAQDLSPSVAQARSRLAQARATQTASRAALRPTLDGQASASRGFNEQIGAVASTAQAGLQDDMNSFFNNMSYASNSTSAKAWQGQAARYVSGGSFFGS